MDWRSETWKLEDELYKPKRKVNNRGSYWHPHIIGGFYSQKMDRTVEYESLGERLYYYFLELDREVHRYYVQPIEVSIPIKSNKSEEGFWKHVPDVLVFRQGSKPLLHQIKNEENTEDPKLQLINYHCVQYALEKNWDYRVIYPKLLPSILQRNIRFLKGFLKERHYYKKWNNDVIHRLSVLEEASVQKLSESLKDQTDPLLMKPLIFHLIAHGLFNVDVNVEINSSSIVTVNHHLISTLNGRELLFDVFKSNSTLF